MFPMGGMMNARNVSKKTRFEVFKRDKFTCQYCGRRAPDVVLNCDHIRPVADNGSNGIMNLVTSCAACNSGKSDRKLDDSESVEKARKQAELMQERAEQIEMMAEWAERCAMMRPEIVAINKALHGMGIGALTQRGEAEARKILKKYTIAEYIQALVISIDSYGTEKGFDKINGICYNKRLESIDPGLAEIRKVVFSFRLKGQTWKAKEVVLFLNWLRKKGLDWLAISRGIEGKCKSWDDYLKIAKEISSKVTA